MSPAVFPRGAEESARSFSFGIAVWRDFDNVFSKMIARNTIFFAAAVQVASTSLAATAFAANPCASVAHQTRATVIAYEPPATFTICRDGHEEDAVVTGRPVYVELVPHGGEGMQGFRVFGRATQAEPTGLLAAAQRLAGLAGDLRALASSTQTIAEASGMAPPATASALDQERALYLGVATPRFHEGLAQVAEQTDSLSADAGVLARWCAEVRSAESPPVLAAELRSRCDDPALSPTSVTRQVTALVDAMAAYHSSQESARNALVSARARPEDGPSQARAAAMLQETRHKAEIIVEQAGRIAPLAASLSSATWLVRETLRSAGTLQAGVPRYLTRFGRSGVANLQIAIAPIELAPTAPDASGKPGGAAESMQTFRFPVVSVHLLDIEAGIAGTGGMPQVPVLGTQNVIEGKNLDQFVGLALVELEPVRWLWPERPLAGVLRFPVIGIPFTRDPTQNFFAGIGLGWTGIGSISAGPYVLRELSLQNGATVGSTLMPAAGQTPAQAFAGVTGPELQVGYFVSASIDLVGLFHAFFPVHEPLLDATTGTTP